MRKLLVIIALFAATLLLWRPTGAKADGGAILSANLDPDLRELYERADRNYSKPVALAIADTLMQLSALRGNTEGQCLAYLVRIDYYNSQLYKDINKLTEAVEDLKQYALKTNHQYYAFLGWDKLVKRHQRRYNYQAALRELHDYQETALRLNHPWGISNSYSLYSRVYSAMGNHEAAIEYSRQGLEYLIKNNIKEDQAQFYSDIGIYYFNMQQYDSAEHYLNIAANDPDASNEVLLSTIYIIARIQSLEERHEDLDANLKRFKAILEETPYSNKYHRNHYYRMRVGYYLALGDYEKALYETSHVHSKMDSLECLQRIYEKQERWQEAFRVEIAMDSLQMTSNMKHVMLQVAQQDSILKHSLVTENRQRLALANAQLELEKAQIQENNVHLELQKAHAEQQRAEQKVKNQQMELENQSLQLSKERAQLEQAQAEAEEAQAYVERIELIRDRNNMISLIVSSIIVILAVGTITYMRYRQNLITALQHKHDKALEMNQIKELIIQNLRHEVRTPLNAIVGFSELLSMADELGLSEQERAEYSTYIMHNTMTLTTITDDLIDMAKIESGSYEMIILPVYIAEICQMAVLNNEIKKPTNVQIINNVHGNKLRLYTDRARLQQVISNLISNACKYTTAGTISLDVEDCDTFFRFSVTDTGQGIPKGQEENAFERFEKLGSQVQGMGLGLSICRTIVDMLGGRIYVDETYEEGCRIVFTHPKNMANAV